MNTYLEKYLGISLTLPKLPDQFIQLNACNSTSRSLEDNLTEHNSLPFARSDCFTLPIKSSRILNNISEDVKQCYEIILDCSMIPDIQYDPGSTIAILPVNSDIDVDYVLTSMNCNSNEANIPTKISLRSDTKKKNAKLPIFLPVNKINRRKLLSEYLDLHSIPKKLFLRSLIPYTTDPDEKRFLEILTSKEASAVYTKYILEECRTVSDILKACPSISSPINILLEHLPRLMPRPYSLACSPLQEKSELKIIFSLQMPNVGLTTGMIRRIINEENTIPRLNCYFRNPSFPLYKVEIPAICICIGTGIAPFIGFMEHRRLTLKQQPNKKLGFFWLITGSRYRERNNLYHYELEDYLSDRTLNRLHQAFSRDPHSEYKYVQDVLKENINSFIDMFIGQESNIYVCGSKKMADDVRDCIVKYLTIEDNPEDILKMILDAKSSGRYIEDVWS